MSAIVAGVVSQLAVTDTTSDIQLGLATSATGDVSAKLYRSQTVNFTPGAGNLVATFAGPITTVQNFHDTGLIPNTTYYYSAVYEDASGPTDVQSNYVTTLTAPMSLKQTQFDIPPALVGTIDLARNNNTISVKIDESQGSTPLYAGMPVKFVNPLVSSGDGKNGPPTVVGITAITDQIDGYLNYSTKDRRFGIPDPNQGFLPQQIAEMSRAGNYMYLMATGNGNRGDAAVVDIRTGGGVLPAGGSTGGRFVGEFIDVPAIGFPARVELVTGPFVGLDS